MGNDSIVAELAGCLPGGEIVSDPGRLAAYRHDETHAAAGEPLCAVVARGVADIVATMRFATRRRVPVVPRGAGTGLAGGATATAGCVVLVLDAMTAIRELSADDMLAVVEPGVITADLARAAAELGLMYPVDPGSAERSTLGGNLATNAGGFRCYKYGVTRDSVLGLDVVLADGRLLRTGGRTSKGVTGYDLTSLFVGSEGTLGVIAGATLRLRARPAGAPATAAAFYRDAARAAGAALALTRAGLRPSLLELVDDVTLRELEEWKAPGLPRGAALLLGQFDSSGSGRAAAAMARLCADTGALATEVVTGAEESGRLMDIRRQSLAAVSRLGRTMVEDFAVPRSRLPEMLTLIRRIADRHGVFVATVAHAGDGNLHPTFLYDHAAADVPEKVWAAAGEMFRAALELGGTLTGEHGVGTLKRRWLRDELGDEGIEVHRAVKDALDPLGLMNPGKVL
ncbi:FAD-linked oxidase C-terminal domain-containing protein [Sphaerisporangium sp. B11E5]|uniref:FAD-binding oxidoreductase n=1 Tax=Sphaerisporangium sp. B11E5 TaxID=3153563 RepID=UPI00325DAC8E